MKKLLAVLLIVALASPAIGQEAAKNRVLSIKDFSGGLVTKVSDYSLQEKFADIAENIRLNASVTDISKRELLYLFGTADTTEPITSMHRYYSSSGDTILLATHGDELEVASDTTGVFTTILALTTADYRWDWVTWHDLAIGGDGYNSTVKTDGTDATYLGTCFGEDSGAGTGPVAGTYSYKVSFYTSSYEVIFAVISAPVVNAVGNHDISLSMIPIGPDTYLGEDVTGRKIYRNKLAAQTTWFLMSNGTIANNTATTLTDSDTDAELSATEYPAGDETWTPPKCKLWHIHQNRLFGANNPDYPSRIYYSKDGSHDLFQSSTDYFEIRKNDGGAITVVETLLGVLTISKTTTWQKLYTSGSDPSADWEISDPFSYIGCDAPHSAVNTPIGILYLSKSMDGIYVFNGQHSVIKSEKVTPTIQDISPSILSSVTGEYNNNIYYLAYTSSETGVSYNNRVLVYDMLLDAFMIDTLNINDFCSFTSGQDGGALFAGASDSGKIYQYSSISKTIIHRLHTDFTGTWDDMRYLPEVAGGSSTSPTLELAWDCTIDGWGTEILTKDAGWDGTIDDISSSLTTAVIDRPDGTGTYISPVMNTAKVSAYDKIYWNEVLPGGTDATFSIRSKATSPPDGAWTNEYTTVAGSDISAETANIYTQYRVSMSTDDTSITPNVTTLGGLTVKLTYNTVGTPAETTIAIHHRTGWLDMGLPVYDKALRKLYLFLEGTNGTITITVTNEYGDSDSFTIDASTYPTFYAAQFTNGILKGKKFQIDVTNSDLYALKIREMYVLYDVEPLF